VPLTAKTTSRSTGYVTTMTIVTARAMGGEGRSSGSFPLMFWLCLRNAVVVISPRGPLVVRRMTAHWVVIAAAGLTTLVAAAVAAALAVFTGQALPQAVRHDLVLAPGTALSVSTLVSTPGQAASETAALRPAIAAALPGIRFSFHEALWSDPLGLVPGALPAPPPSAGQGSTALLAAASLSGIVGQASLIAGHWPAAAGGRRGQAIPAALPAAAAALLHVRVSDELRLRDQTTSAPVSFDITGIFARRQTARSWSQACRRCWPRRPAT